MKWIIEVEETVKIRHQIYVEAESDEQLDDVIGNMNSYYESLDDCLDNLDDAITILGVNNEHYEESEGVEYYDDYEDDEY